MQPDFYNNGSIKLRGISYLTFTNEGSTGGQNAMEKYPPIVNCGSIDLNEISASYFGGIKLSENRFQNFGTINCNSRAGKGIYYIFMLGEGIFENYGDINIVDPTENIFTLTYYDYGAPIIANFASGNLNEYIDEKMMDVNEECYYIPDAQMEESLTQTAYDDSVSRVKNMLIDYIDIGLLSDKQQTYCPYLEIRWCEEYIYWDVELGPLVGAEITLENIDDNCPVIIDGNVITVYGQYFHGTPHEPSNEPGIGTVCIAEDLKSATYEIVDLEGNLLLSGVYTE